MEKKILVVAMLLAVASVQSAEWQILRTPSDRAEMEYLEPIDRFDSAHRLNDGVPTPVNVPVIGEQEREELVLEALKIVSLYYMGERREVTSLAERALRVIFWFTWAKNNFTSHQRFADNTLNSELADFKMELSKIYPNKYEWLDN